MKATVLALSLLVSITSLAGELPTPKTLGATRADVVYVTPEAKLVKNNGLTSEYVAGGILRWGTQVFEKVNIYYKCNEKTDKCAYSHYISRGTYEKCTLPPKAVRCYNKLQAEGSSNGYDNQHYGNGPKWYEKENYDYRAPQRNDDTHHLDQQRGYNDPADDGSNIGAVGNGL